jgi:hypothetical protein
VNARRRGTLVSSVESLCKGGACRAFLSTIVPGTRDDGGSLCEGGVAIAGAHSLGNASDV